MPASTDGSDDEEINESREPTMWREVEDTINADEDPMEDVFLTTIISGSEQEVKPIVSEDNFQKGKFVDPLGILRMPPRTFIGKPQNIDDEEFDPVGQLSGIHVSTSFSELVQGMRRLNRKMSSQEEDIKQLVKDNFDRFISCKDVIDGLYEQIVENEMSDTSISSKQVEQTVKDVLTRAKRVYDPLLARKAETDKIRQSLSVLSRFSFLFTLPSKIAANIRDGEYDKAVQHYKKAASIFQDQAAISHVSVFLRVFAEVENIVAGFRSTLYSALSDPSSTFEAQERVIRILVDLARPSDFRLNPEKDPRDDPGWYYLNMAASRMTARLSNTAETITPSASSASITLVVPDAPSFQLNGLAQSQGVTQANSAVYRTVRSACGHVARHLPNLWKMGQYYLEGKFDPRTYAANDKEKEELQAHPQREDKDKLDKTSTVRVFFSDEITSVRLDGKKSCAELVELCLRRVEGEHHASNYAIYTWVEKRRKKDGTKVIKITELAPNEKVYKIHKKWGDKANISHKFLFKRKDEKFPRLHDPRAVVEDYSLEMRSTTDSSKNTKKQVEGRKHEADFLALITSVLSVFSERVEYLFFQVENAEDEFEADMVASTDDQSEEWAFGKMRSQVLDVVTTLNVLQRVGMSEKYLTSVTRLVLKLCGHYVSKVCGQWSGEVSLLYLSAVPRTQGVTLDSSVGLPIVVNVPLGDDPAVHLPAVFAATTKFYLAQFKGIVSKGHPMMTQIQAAFGESLKCFADTLHHLAFNYVDDEFEDEKTTNKVHNKLRIVSYILETRNMVIGSLWSHFNELFKLSTTHQVEEEVLGSALDVMHHLGSMTVARYVHDRLTGFTKILRYGILLAPAVEWATAPLPTAVSEYAMSVLLHFVYVSSELAILEPGSEYYREHRHQFEKVEKEGLLEGTPEAVIGKLIGGMVWGMMEGFRRCLDQLDGGAVSVCGVYQLRLDFCFLEAILSRYSNEQTTGVSQAVHNILSQMEDDALQNGAGEDPIEVDIDTIVEDTSRRSVVLFGSLTGNAESPISPKINFTIPKKEPPKKKAAISADVSFGAKDSKVADMLRKVRNDQENARAARETSLSPKNEVTKVESPSRMAPKTEALSPPARSMPKGIQDDLDRKPSSVSYTPKMDDRSNGSRGGSEPSMMDKLREERKERERKKAQEKMQAREQNNRDQKEREQREKDQKEREQRDREQKEREHKEKESVPAPAVASSTAPSSSSSSSASSGSGSLSSMKSREEAKARLRERELAKRK